MAHANDPAARVTEGALLVAYSTGVGETIRSRAWSYTLDGHTFYVLNLGEEGTFLYDDTTGQWCQFQTGGMGQWNMLNGHEWEEGYIVGGDILLPTTWKLQPDGVLDEGWRPIEHKVNGGIPTRSRDSVPFDELNLFISSGIIGEDGAVLSMRFSDDNGRTWGDWYDITLTQSNYAQEICWLSLGSFAAPGRIFEFRDVGGMIRIDDCGARINGEE